MIIGVSGKIFSGKDTVGRIIQILDPKNKWEIKKYADPLKDVICILIGCTREQLESQAFKDSYLSSEWDLPLKKYTVRKLLQEVGTDAIRNVIHTNAWVNALFNKYKEYDDIQVNSIYPILHKYPNWIITDCRFINEAEAIKKRGGVVIRVNRDIYNYRDDKYTWKQLQELLFIETGEYPTKEYANKHWKSTHESEIALDDYEFDYTIDNNDISMEELIEKVKQILKNII